MTIDRKDLGAGAAFIAVALLYGGIAYRSLPVGEALSMGPGYFPLVLSMLLAVVGVILVLRSLAAGEPTPFFGRIAWRGIVAISLAIIVFGTFLRELGLLIAVFATSFICSLASRGVKPAGAAVLAVLLAIFCALIFGYGVRLPIPIVGTWFTQ